MSGIRECTKCGRAGCNPNSPLCSYFGRERLQHPDAGWGDNVPHMRELRWERQGQHICIEGELFAKGKATGQGNNCLIDTLRQTLGLEVDVRFVRRRLQSQFHRPGADVVLENNFLDLAYHWSAVINALFLAKQSKRDSQDFKVVCVDLRFGGNGDVVGTGPTTLYIAREGACHFVPLHRRPPVPDRPADDDGEGAQNNKPTASENQGSGTPMGLEAVSWCRCRKTRGDGER